MLVLFSHFGYNEINIHRPTYILLLIVFVACDAFWSLPQLISAANDKIQRKQDGVVLHSDSYVTFKTLDDILLTLSLPVTNLCYSAADAATSPVIRSEDKTPIKTPSTWFNVYIFLTYTTFDTILNTYRRKSKYKYNLCRYNSLFYDERDSIQNLTTLQKCQ